MRNRPTRCALPLFLATALVPVLAAAAPWPAEKQREILDKTQSIRLDPDLSHLTAGERAALGHLIQVGEIVQRVYEDALHPQALAARAKLETTGEAGADLRTLYRLFRGPIATTLDNRREPFLDVDPPQAGRNFYPWGIEEAEVRAFLAAHPESEAEILAERTVVRRANEENLTRDLAALHRHPVLAGLHPGLADRLTALAAEPDPKTLYAVPYAVAWSDETIAAQRGLFLAADAVEADDAELARYLRNRGRDLLSNDYESGDASWVTGDFRNLNAQIGAYETYDDALFGVKAAPSTSLLVRDVAASEELEKTLGGLQSVEDSLPYEAHKRVRERIPVGVYSVVADFGQARGTNTATILPNDPLFSSRYGRTILLRENIMKNPVLWESAGRRWRAAVAPEHAAQLTPDGPFQRTLWHEIGHYLGYERTRDGRPIDQALQGWADAVEEMKADLVSLFASERFHRDGRIDDARLQSIHAGGILRTLQVNRPRRDQPYQTMQLVQFNYFLAHGLLEPDAEGRLRIHYERYAETVAAMLREVLELQGAGDPAAADAFFARWTEWRDDLHAPLAARLREAAGPRFTEVHYAALGD